MKERRKTICQTTLDSRIRRNSRISVVNVNEDSVCCVVASLLNFVLFNMIVVINEQSLKVFSHTATLKSLHCMSSWSVSTWCCRADVFETEQVLLESRGEFFFRFLFVLCTSCNELFSTFLMSGDVCDEVMLHSWMFKSAAFLSKHTSVKMCKHLRGINVFVLMCSLKANASCVPLGEMLDIDDLDPARLSTEKVHERLYGFDQS